MQKDNFIATMADAYQDPFSPLPQLSSAQPEPTFTAASAYDGEAFWDGLHFKDLQEDADSLDAYSCAGESEMFAESDSDYDQRNGEDHNMDHDLAADFEPIPLKEMDNTSLFAGRVEEDSLSALPFLSSVTASMGYGKAYPRAASELGASPTASSYYANAHPRALSEHGKPALTASSYSNSGSACNDSDARNSAGASNYSFYARPKSYNFTRPAYVKDQNCDTQSAHSTRSAPACLASQAAYGNRFAQSMQLSSGDPGHRHYNNISFPANVSSEHSIFNASEHGTTMTASSYNDYDQASTSETYSFYARPQTFELKRPAYVQEQNYAESHSSQFRADSSVPLEEFSMQESPCTLAQHESFGNQFQGADFHLPGRRTSCPELRPKVLPSFDVLSCESMPVSSSFRLGLPLTDSCDDVDGTASLPEISAVKVHKKDKPKLKETSETRMRLVEPSDRAVATGFSFAVLSEYTLCTFAETDRQGKRKGLSIGFPGMKCYHCNGTDRKGGRFFPSTIKTMADTKKTLISIHNHIMKCPKCPEEVKEEILRLRHLHDEERYQQKYGSQKKFFLNIWSRIHGEQPAGADTGKRVQKNLKK